MRDVTKLHYKVTKDSMTDLASEVTAYAKASKSEWPFVTMPLFEVNANHARNLAGIEALGICPLVQREQREAWEAYSMKNFGWIDESRSVVLDDETLENSEYVPASILPFIYQIKNETDPTSLPTPVDPEREVCIHLFLRHLLSFQPLFLALNICCIACRSTCLRAFCQYGNFRPRRFMDS